MLVKVRLSTLLRQATNWQEVLDMEADTPLDCLKRLEEKYPEVRKWIYDPKGRMWDQLRLFLNGELLQPGELSRPLKEGDELSILLSIGGG